MNYKRHNSSLKVCACVFLGTNLLKGEVCPLEQTPCSSGLWLFKIVCACVIKVCKTHLAQTYSKAKLPIGANSCHKKVGVTVGGINRNRLSYKVAVALLAGAMLITCSIFSACQSETDNYRTGSKVSEAYVDPSKVKEVTPEELKTVGYNYEYEKLTYDLVWSDEFDYEGLPEETKWNYDTGGSGWGNHELQYYTSDKNASVTEGNLVIEARKEEKEGMKYTSARLVSRDKGDWLYGKIEVRAKLPAGLGTWPAIWMLPTDWEYGSWPASGEIDIMEHVGYNQNTIHASIHTQSYYHKINTQKTSTKYVEGVNEDFHVYSIEWLPDKILAFIDGEQYFSFEPGKITKEPTYKEWPFDKRMHLLLNIAVGGDWGGAKGLDDSIFPVQMLVDYVRVYQSKEIMELTR